MTASLLLHPGTKVPTVALLVDPHADTRRMYAEYLKRSSCIIEEADDGRAALAKAISGRPDITSRKRSCQVSTASTCAASSARMPRHARSRSSLSQATRSRST
jgi:hypothetical protein